MRRQFLRVYAGLFVAALLLAALAQAVMVREVRQQVDARLVENFEAPLLRMRDRVREVGDDPESVRQTLTEIRRDVGSRVRILAPEAAILSDAERQQLAAGETLVVRNDGRRVLAVQVDDSRVLLLGPVMERGGRRRPGFTVVVTGLTVLLIGVVLYLLLRPIERRLAEMSEVAERFGRGELQARVATANDDGIGRLGRQFNAMAEQIARLIDRQRHQLRAVSHELRTPLARVFFLVDEALEARTPREKDQTLRRIEHSVHEMNELVEELLLFARLDSDVEEVRLESVDVPALFAELQEVALELKPTLALEARPDVDKLIASQRYLRRALLNLVTNATRFATTQVLLTAQTQGEWVEFRIEDDGIGVPEASREAIFEPFAQLDAREGSGHQGAGLGLAIVRRISRAHGGDVHVETSSLGGAAFVLRIPRRPAATVIQGSASATSTVR
jgi:two-component system sensor histidine kinase RstB